MNVQLPLTIKFDEQLTFDNFVSGPNSHVVQFLETLSETSSQSVYLWGNEGTGKTHLAQAIYHAYVESDKRAAYIDISETGLSPAILEGMEQYDCLILDSVEVVVAFSEWQIELFHTFNRCSQSKANLVITSIDAPVSLEKILPDLSSRLLSDFVFQIKDISDEDKLIALRLRAKEIGLELPVEVGRYWLNHFPRESHLIFAQLRQLDTASMSQQRKLTIPFLKQTLEI